MGRRSLVISSVVFMLMLVWAPAALAGDGRLGNGPDGQGPPGRMVEQPVDAPHGSTARAKAQGPSENGRAHAAENASRGMNREGSPGEWNDNGHAPAAQSAPQGRSPSDPDADANGGMDKPGGSGGFDADKDGNNGCGNDTDREDDNNGWCGKKPQPAPPPPPPPVTPPSGGGQGGGPPVSVPPPAPTPTEPIKVLPGPRLTEPGLAQTGVDIGQAFIAGWGLVLAGTSMRARTRRSVR